MQGIPTISQLTKSIGSNDYEELELIEHYVAKWRARHEMESQRDEARRDPKGHQKRQLELTEEVKTAAERLGYMPGVQRPPRPTGRPRAKALPDPMPDIGTELTSCLGEMYRITGYGRTPSAKIQDLVIYTVYDLDGKVKRDTVCRNATHLFTGTLASGMPFVTWPDDPRGFKPEQPIPMNKRRTLTKAQLKADEHADTTGIITPEERMRRY